MSPSSGSARRGRSPAAAPHRLVASAALALWLGSAAPGVASAAEAGARSLEAASASESSSDLIRRLDAANKELKTLSTDFRQTSRVRLFKQEVQAEGRLYYDRGDAGKPSRLRWEYLKPDPSTMLIIGDRATLRMGSREPQVFDTGKDPTLRAVFAQLRLWLGQGSFAEADGREYDMAVSPGKATGGSAAAASLALVLTPRPASPLAKTFSRIELHVDSKSLGLLRIRMEETSGDEKEIEFLRVRRNGPLPARAFE